MIAIDRIISAALTKKPDDDALHRKILLLNSFKVIIENHPVQYAARVSRNTEDMEGLLEALLEQQLTTYSSIMKDMKVFEDE